MPPVNEIELSSAHTGRKMVLMIVFMAIGVAAFVYGIMQLLDARETGGWQEIGVASEELSCGGDFTLLYDLGPASDDISAVRKRLTDTYSDAAVTAYRLFSNDSGTEDVHGLRYMNRHPNEIVTVDPALYSALELVQQAGDRTIYLGPLVESCSGLFACENDAQAAEFDPRQNEAVGAYFARCAAFASDPDAIDLELLGGGEVRLKVSEEYLAYAQQEEIVSFLDFGWMKNAFVADYLADRLLADGFAHGVLSSFDGFARCLDDRGVGYGMNILDRTDAGVFQAGTLSYTGRRQMVSLRDYPLSEQDSWRYYTFEDGNTFTSYLDPADGLSRCAVHDLSAWSVSSSCGQLILALAPVYVADDLDGDALTVLAAEGIYTARCVDRTILCTDPDAVLTDLYEGYSAG